MSVSALAASRLASPTLSGVGSARVPFFRSLSDSEIAALSASEIGEMQSADMAALSDRQIKAFNPQALASGLVTYLNNQQALPANFIDSLGNNQISQFGVPLVSATLPQMSPTQINAFTQEQVRGLSTSQIAGLGVQKTAALSAAWLNKLSSTQLQGMGTAFVKALTKTQIAGLDATRVQYLSEGQVASLSKAQLSVLNGNQIAAIDATDIKAMSTVQFATLTKTQLQALTAGQIGQVDAFKIRTISAKNLASLTYEQIGHFTTKTVTNFTGDQLASLTREQIRQGLDAAKMGALSASRVRAFSGGQFSAMTNEEIDAFSLDTMKTLYDRHLNAFTVHQLSSLTEEKIDWLINKKLNIGFTGQQKDAIFARKAFFANVGPTTTNIIADQSAAKGVAFSLTVPINTFAGANVGDTLSYSASVVNESAVPSSNEADLPLPSWLHFDAGTRTFTGTPDSTVVGVFLKVTATDPTGASASSAFKIAVVNNSAPAGSVTINGTPKLGEVLTAANDLVDGDGLGLISYQWMTNGSKITGATGNTLTITQSHAGKAISVKASYTDGHGIAESATSAATRINAPPTGSVTITGIPKRGQVLTAGNNLADADRLGTTISYQWLANGGAISGATQNTLTLTEDHVGKAISVRASYTDALGTAESKTSETTGLVTSSGTTESANIQFPPLLRGQSITVDGLSFTAKRATTDVETAAAFANLSPGQCGGVGASYGRYQGTLGSFNSASSIGNQLVMTSVAHFQDVPDITLVTSGVEQTLAPSVSVSQNPIPAIVGVTETSSIKFTALLPRQSVTVAGLQFTASRTLSSAEVASAFANLQSGAATGAGTSFGTYTGAIADYSSGAAASDTVLMTSTTQHVNVSNVSTLVNDRVEGVPQIYKAGLSTPPNPSPLINQTNSYIEYTDLGTSGEIISLTKVSNPNVANDAISIVGTTVYRGIGNTAEAIGTVDSQLDGTAGKALRINLRPQFQNGNFDNGTAGSQSITGWTAINQRVKLDGTSMVAGWPTPIDTTTAPDGGTETTGGSGTFNTSLSSKSASDLSVELNSDLGGVINTPTGSGGVLHGPVLVSNESVRMNQGDTITFDWKAQGGSDAFDVYAYILNTESGQTEQILNATGVTAATQQPWTTVSHTVTNAGDYKFVFVSGSWDETRGTAAGAKLFIDNVNANSSVLSTLTGTQVSSLTSLVQYQNSTPVTASITIDGVTATSGPSASVAESAANLQAAITSLISSGAIVDIAVARSENEISLTSTSPGAAFTASSGGTSNPSLISMGFSQTQAPVLGIDAPALPVVTTTNGISDVAGTAQVSHIAFPAMKIGQSVTVSGLTFTATSEITGSQVAIAFANIQVLGTTGTQQSLGVYSGMLTGFGSGTSNGNQLPFTCAQINTNAVDIPISVNQSVGPPNAPLVQTTQGKSSFPPP